MKLYNHTKLDSEICERVILEASKAIGAVPRTKHIPIKVVTCKGWSIKGTAYKGQKVSLAFMTRRQGRRINYDECRQMIEADGIMVLRIPIFKGRAFLQTAEDVFAIVAHEWRHIRDYQKGLKFDSHSVLYYNRCQEKRARRSEKLAEQNLHKMKEAQEAVLDLAINLEGLAEEREKKGWDNRKRKIRTEGPKKKLKIF